MKRLTTIVRALAVAGLLAGACLAADSDRDKLSVKASATEVHLQWFERKPVIVERGTPNGAFQQLGIAQEGEFTDAVIDAHQTYIYRVTPVSGPGGRGHGNGGAAPRRATPRWPRTPNRTMAIFPTSSENTFAWFWTRTATRCWPTFG